jgi:hypothetical protein
MHQNDQAGKQAWQSPEIVDVGGVIETTTIGNETVRDNDGVEPPSYHDPFRRGPGGVEPNP